jgi:polyhydroxyalkanoate synthesis regulator phasin
MPPKIPTIPHTADWQRAFDAGVHFTELRRSQARAIVADLVAQGHLARDQVGAAVEDVIETSRRRSEDLRKVVQNEVQRQLGALGLATTSDLAALERRLTRSTGDGQRAPAKSAAAKKKAPAKKAPAKPTTGTKAAAKKASAKRAASKPAPKAG